MRQTSPALADALLASISHRLVADVYHGADRVMQDLDLTEWDYQWDLSADIKSGGSAVVVYQPPAGASFAPQGMRGALSPYRGARIQASLLVQVGALEERVVLGWGRIMQVPEAKDEYAMVGGVERCVSSRVKIVWDGLDTDIQSRGFRYPTEARGRSCWSELRAITGFPVIENVADANLPAGTVWEAKQGGRLEAVQAIGSALGGRIVVTPAGELSLAPNTLGPVVATLRTGALGTITDITSPISLDGVYTAVVGVYETEDRAPIYSVAEVPAGTFPGLPERTRYHASDLVKHQEAADKATKSVLMQSLGSLTYRVAVQCLVDPRIEINDHVRVEAPGRTVQGRVVAVKLGASELMNLALDVPMEVPL
ncbi:hypothetical protein [Mycetocola saprophilus]|uniref:hypothetical protein n=1 Tax=Mycetocola saprophilus TaxID=76636 RepID=UPI0004BEC8FB|nr:hypothetical protein [Mycetocola saprophilus]